MNEGKSKLDVVILKSPFKKMWIASELGITPTALSTIIRNPSMLEKDKLKTEKLCQILNVDKSEII